MLSAAKRLLFDPRETLLASLTSCVEATSATTRGLWLSRNPVGDEHIDLVRRFAVAVGNEHQLLAVGRKLGKGAEAAREGDSLQPAAVAIHGVEFELARSGVLVVGSEDDAAAAGKERRRETGAAQVGDLLLAAAVRMHHPQLHLAGFDQPLRQ